MTDRPPSPTPPELPLDDDEQDAPLTDSVDEDDDDTKEVREP